MNVKWYRDATLLEDETYNVDASTYFCDTQVSSYNKIVITIGNMQRPNRFLKIFNISDGITRQFYNDELENVEIIEEISTNSKTLDINESSLLILPATTTGVLFQRTLPFTIYRNEVLFGKFFIDTSTSNTDKTLYKLKVSDFIKTLDAQTYLGGVYSGTNIASLINDILSGSGIPFEIDGILEAQSVSGYLPIMTKREALRQIAFCSNSYIDTSRSDKLIIKKELPSIAPTTIPPSNIISIETTQENIVTEIELDTELLTTRNASTDEIYRGTLNGTQSILFDEPKFDLTISGGTIVSSNCNYAIISGTGSTVVLSGKTYEKYTKIETKSNPYTVTTDVPKIEKYTTTLTCDDINIMDKLEFVDLKIKSKFKMGDIKVGDEVYLNGQKCRVMTLSYDLGQTEIYANAELEAYYEWFSVWQSSSRCHK